MFIYLERILESNNLINSSSNDLKFYKKQLKSQCLIFYAFFQS